MKRFLAVVLLIITSVIVFAPSSYAAEKNIKAGMLSLMKWIAYSMIPTISIL